MNTIMSDQKKITSEDKMESDKFSNNMNNQEIDTPLDSPDTITNNKFNANRFQNQKNQLQKQQGFDDNEKYNQFGEVKDISKSVVINRKLYTYIGKPHPEIIQLFELLEKSVDKESKYKFIRNIKSAFECIEDCFDKTCIFFGGRMKISVYEFFTYVFFFAILLVYTLKMSV